MINRIKRLTTWLAIAVLAGGAFVGGTQLRAWQNLNGSIPGENTSVQANAMLKLTPEWSPVPLTEAPRNESEQRNLVSTVVKLLRQHYVEPITPEREVMMARGAVRGMLDFLDDPDSRFLDPTERKFLDDAGAGKFHGIGAVLSLRKTRVDDLDIAKITIVAPMPGSPAEKAGLKSGDVITYLDGKWIVTHDPFKEANLKEMAKAVRNKVIDEFTYQKAFEAALKRLNEGLNISDALETLTTKKSGTIRIRVERPGENEAKEFDLVCKDTIVDPVVAKMLRSGIAYIRVAQFNSRAVGEFETELNKARAGHAKALVLDLRNNPGGLMDSAANIAGKIAGGGMLATVQEKPGKRTIRMPRARALKLPVAILVNSGTASVAELVAGTLKDNHTAVIVGDRTFGDGLTQTPLLLKDGSAAVVTTGKMLTAKGVDFNSKGIQPDKKIAQESNEGDAQLMGAERILLAKMERSDKH